MKFSFVAKWIYCLVYLCAIAPDGGVRKRKVASTMHEWVFQLQGLQHNVYELIIKKNVS